MVCAEKFWSFDPKLPYRPPYLRDGDVSAGVFFGAGLEAGANFAGSETHRDKKVKIS